MARLCGRTYSSGQRDRCTVAVSRSSAVTAVQHQSVQNIEINAQRSGSVVIGSAKLTAAVIDTTHKYLQPQWQG